MAKNGKSGSGAGKGASQVGINFGWPYGVVIGALLAVIFGVVAVPMRGNGTVPVVEAQRVAPHTAHLPSPPGCYAANSYWPVYHDC